MSKHQTTIDALQQKLVKATALLASIDAHTRQPNEGHLEFYERMADEFMRVTGKLAPGKSQSMEVCQDDHEGRQQAWDAWWDKRIQNVRDYLAKPEAGGDE